MFALLTLSLAARAVPAQTEQPREPERSARDWIERAAFAEEHERAFEEAAELFARAVEAARASGDAAAETEASAGLARLSYRRGEAQDPGDAPAPIRRRIEALLLELSEYNKDSDDNLYEGRLRDLALFGARAVPYLEEGLTARVTLGGASFTFSTLIAALGLAQIDAPEAIAALERALESQDPFIRRDVAVAMYPAKHASLLVRAARDPVEEVRTAAYRSLRYSGRPDMEGVTEVMEAGAREGNGYSSDWMGDWARERVLEMLAEDDLDPTVRVRLVQSLHRRGVAELTSGMVTELVAVARDAPALREDIGDLLGSTVRRRSFSYEVGEAIETAILADLGSFLSDDYLQILQSVGGPRSIEALVAEVAAGRAPAESLNGIGRALSALVGASSVDDFEMLTRTFRNVPARRNDATRFIFDALRDGLYQLVKEEVAAAQIRAGYQGLDGDHRNAYQSVVARWLSVPSRTEETLDPEMAPLLRDLIASDDEDVRRIAVYALRSIVDAESIEAAFAMRADPDGRVQSTADSTLSELCQEAPNVAAPLFSKWLAKSIQDDGDVSDVKVLSFLPNARALEVFDRLWPLARTTPVKSALLRQLVAIAGEEASLRLCALYHEIPASDSYWRKQAIARFGHGLVEAAMPILGDALEDPDANVRAQAREAFQAFKEHREALEEYAAWTAQDREARASIQELLSLLASDNKDVVLGAIDALAALKAKGALAPLVRMLEQGDDDVKAAAREAIRRIGE